MIQKLRLKILLKGKALGVLSIDPGTVYSNCSRFNPCSSYGYRVSHATLRSRKPAIQDLAQFILARGQLSIVSGC